MGLQCRATDFALGSTCGEIMNAFERIAVVAYNSTWTVEQVIDGIRGIPDLRSPGPDGIRTVV